jgi:hypothetical protein
MVTQANETYGSGSLSDSRRLKEFLNELNLLYICNKSRVINTRANVPHYGLRPGRKDIFKFVLLFHDLISYNIYF